MFPDYNALSASDGSGESVRASVLSTRDVGSADIDVDAITNYPTGTFIATTGTLLANNKLDPATVQVFYGTATDDTITITGFAAGYTDLGNSEGDVVVIKPSTEWANTMAEAISSFASAGVPSGSLVAFAGATAPSNWLLCQGQAISRTTYAHLFSAISTTYGVGDGSTTFNVPDMRGNIAAGYKSGDANFGTLGQTGGEDEHTLTAAEQADMPVQALGADYINQGNSAALGGYDYTPSGTNEGGNRFTAIGGGGAHNNLQPYNTFQYIIKT